MRPNAAAVPAGTANDTYADVQGQLLGDPGPRPDPSEGAAGHLLERNGLRVMKHSHPTLRALRKELPQPSLHGTQVCRSSYQLMEHLWANPIADGQRVMELGCGWGLLGIFCTKHFDAKVLLTDAAPPGTPLCGDACAAEPGAGANQRSLLRRHLHGLAAPT